MMGIISDAERCARQKYDFPPLSKSLYHPREALLFEGSGKTVLTGQLQQIDQAVYPAHPSKLQGVVGKMEKAQNQTYRHTGKKERKSPKTSTKGCPQKCLSRYKNLSLALSLFPFFFLFVFFLPAFILFSCKTPFSTCRGEMVFNTIQSPPIR